MMLPKSRDPKLQAELRQQESQYDEPSRAQRAELLHAEEAGVLEAEGEMEATWRFKQSEIKSAVNMLTARKIFDLSLPEYGPYCGVDYTKRPAPADRRCQGSPRRDRCHDQRAAV